ncbi:MAG: PfkB family carbohydrate kinase, partial [Actinomycetia bacterium]|nr:PfkB family carbohydrate kinase [Actinomycetes bacterium]
MLCCLGDVVEDVVVWLSSDVATGTDTAVSIHRRRGGSAANVAVAAANTGTGVRFIGRVGTDAIGRSLIGDLAIAGVDARVQQQGRTGTIVVLVHPGGERSMLPDRAAAVELDSIDDTDLAGVTWLHVPAYSLVVEPLGAASREAIRKVQRTGGKVSIDASSVAIIEDFGIARFSAMIDALKPDVLFCNADEGNVLAMTDSRGASGADLTVVKNGEH